MVWTLPEPMLAEAVNEPALPKGCAAEPKWDGYRALVAKDPDGQAVIRSRRGTDMTHAFPEIAAAASALPSDVCLDGELVVWDGGRIAFERLQGRLTRGPGGGARLAEQWPAHFVVFDLLRLGTDLTSRPYAARRAALEKLFADHALPAPWTLCPSTTDPGTAAGWLEWSQVGMEGLVFKKVTGVYRPGARGWKKYRSAHTTDAVIAAVSGSPADPRTALFGRYDAAGQLRLIGRSSVLSGTVHADLTARLVAEAGEHPWAGETFSDGGWGAKDALPIVLVVPDLVAEVRADVTQDSTGKWRHPVKLVRLRDDLAVSDVPLFGGGGGDGGEG
jgi:ATP-dependent DNA ligase